MKRKDFLYIFLLFPHVVSGQDITNETHWWQLTSLNGAAKVEGLYRNQQMNTNSIYENQKSSLVWGGLQLNTSSYIWHPNFLSLDIGGEYNPEKRKELYLVVPDQAEAVTAKKVDFSAIFFKRKPINLGVYANYNESYNARENLSNIKTKGSVV